MELSEIRHVSFRGGVIEKLNGLLHDILQRSSDEGTLGAYTRIACWFKWVFPVSTLDANKSYKGTTIERIFALMTIELATCRSILKHVPKDSSVVLFAQMQIDAMERFETLLVKIFMGDANLRWKYFIEYKA